MDSFTLSTNKSSEKRRQWIFLFLVACNIYQCHAFVTTLHDRRADLFRGPISQTVMQDQQPFQKIGHLNFQKESMLSEVINRGAKGRTVQIRPEPPALLKNQDPFFQSSSTKNEDLLAPTSLPSRREFLRTSALAPMVIALLNARQDAAAAAPIDEAAAPPLNTPNPSLILLEEVEKSPNDPRTYRAVELKNRLQVLLVSDPSAKTAAAAMDVHVGHFSDPDDLPGLAHFCEHMLFLGTQKYPREDEFNSYLAQHGGENNAYTDTQDTVYYFDINADYLEPALDRFAQFFIAPLFTESATGRELNAIESENSKNFQSDGFRLYQFEKSLANPEHPYSKFGTGNLDTLQKQPKKKGIDLREALKTFHGMYYSSNAMTLCIVGKQSLDELQAIASRLFEPVPLLPNYVSPETKWDGRISPFLPQKEAISYKVVPVQDQRAISLTWTLPYDEMWAGKYGLKERRALKPEVFIGSLLGYEGAGSLLSYLKSQGWVNGLGASEATDTTGFQNFEVTAELTPSGQEKRFEVVKAIFSYLKLIEKEGIPEYIYTDLIQLSSIGWMFQEKTEASTLATATASNMQKWPSKKYISGQSRLEYFDDQLNREFLKRLTPETARVLSVSKTNKQGANNKEYWYGTKYGTEPILQYVKEWQNPPEVNAMAIPQANPFIPTNLSLKGPKSESKSGPFIIADSDLWRVHFKQDLSFGQPKVYAVFQLQSPVPYSSPQAVAAFKMHQLYVADTLNELAYDAQTAGLNYELEFNTKGVRLGFGGYNDKIDLFANEVLKVVSAPGRPSPSEFERYRDIVLRELESFDKQQPYLHAIYNSGLATETPRYEISEVVQALKDVQIKDIDEYVTKAFDRSFGEALVQGNMNKDEALALVAAVQQAVQFTPLPKEERPERYVVNLPTGPNPVVLPRKEQNPDQPNSAVQLLFQFPGRELKDRACIEMIGTILEQPFFDDLRTKQQLGYIVKAGIKRVQGITSLSFLVQSNVANPIDVTNRILKFIDSSESKLEELPEEQFLEFRNGLIEKKLEPQKRLIAATIRNWEEIITGEYKYDRPQQEARILSKLSKDEVVDYFNKHMRKDGEERRVFVSQVYGNKDTSVIEKAKADKKSVVITSYNDFKKTRPVYPPRERAK